ncbi:hypothetical protein A6V37_38380 [Paraburkholderia ginsengiterrae]|uniref:Uncharacterized protein n=1 Tax=Paraburkholderia ginsengiterrae TaxID=1462993 RepID=A0A1A9N5S8_9BURK|nr:hypothetical protein A6V37_38380 [Paraburkholderia ginsengiterrae]
MQDRGRRRRELRAGGKPERARARQGAGVETVVQGGSAEGAGGDEGVRGKGWKRMEERLWLWGVAVGVEEGAGVGQGMVEGEA